MKRDLVMGWVFIALALLMVFCIIINCFNGNWFGLPICGFAFGINISNAINRFRYYKRYKECENIYSTMLMRCWSDDGEFDTAGTLSSGSFIDD